MDDTGNISINTNHKNGVEINLEKTLEAMSNLIASAATAQKNLLVQEQLIEKRLARTEQIVNSNLQEIESTVLHVQETLANANVDGLRSAVESMRSEGKERTQGLQEVYTEAKAIIKKACERAEHASTQILKGLGRTLDSLHPSEFQNLTEVSTEEVKKVSSRATQQITDTVRWFHWKNLFIVFFLSLMVSLSISFYLDDEWPWEVHNTAVKQRLAGAALMNAWAGLSPSDQQLIAQNV